MKTDPYKYKARFYDLLVEPLTTILREILLQMVSSERGMQVMEVGCGTGLNLELCRKAGCDVYGIDLSSAMIALAAKRLKGQAVLHTGDAADIPYPANSFDRVLMMLTLHEMTPVNRFPVIKEALRVLKPDGLLMIVDYHPKPCHSLKGWSYNILIMFTELMAGRIHFLNYRNFIRNNGLLMLLKTDKLKIVQQKTIMDGNMAFYSLKKPINNRGGPVFTP